MKLILCLVLLISVSTFGKANVLTSDNEQHYANDEIEGKPKVFLEGARLDMDYLRRNMRFVDFVNDPAVSDIHIIINMQISGSGGVVYSIRFISRSFQNISEYTITSTTASSDTNEESRKKIADALSLGLMPFVNESDISGNLSILYQSNEENGNNLVETVDPWNNWTFRGNFNGGINAEEKRKSYDYSINLRADKVAEEWKLRNSVFSSFSTTETQGNDKTYVSERIRNNFSSSFVKSLSPRWSVGAFGDYSTNNYSNIEYSVSLKPAIEYNIFPWDMSDRRVFTIAYHVGPEWAKYYKITTYDKLDEFIWQQSLRLDLEIVETWGEINAGFNYSNYLHDFSLNNVRFDTRFSFRIVRGISVNFRFDIERTHDQISLPKESISLEDLLQGNRQLASSFGIGADMGLSIQFGSIYNNIVNNRL
ncbi:MAG: DUF481 domain-containing protein [Prolixibacteraceae bacterium]|nr:DUF481 domain-containing protein [Prolixibacteraceae bacterium]